MRIFSQKTALVLTYVDQVTIFELIFKEAGYVPSTESTPGRFRGCMSVNDEEGIWSMRIRPVRMWFDGASVDHPVERS